MAVVPAFVQELQSLVDTVEAFLAEAKARAAKDEADTKRLAEVEDQFRLRVIPYCNRYRSHSSIGTNYHSCIEPPLPNL